MRGLFSVLTGAIRSSSTLSPYVCLVRNIQNQSLPYPSASLEHILCIFSSCEITCSSAIWSIQYMVRRVISYMGVSVLLSAAIVVWESQGHGHNSREPAGSIIWGIKCLPFLIFKCDFFPTPYFITSIKSEVQYIRRILVFWLLAVKSVKCGLKSTDVLVPALVRM